ncbi:HAD domain-containing protein [uncultured Methanobrevibacter sp.]|uniref:HAD domain-containing protein n=1 Tax=uncultured Methanobrevibacter sp. TaxID=253161 RepID=UPI0025DB0303|nr:HAD domain-containing protein [uncultured Methanobrevibacter sp.]
MNGDKQRKIVFLDIDGVLNHPDWYDIIHKKYSSEEIKELPFNVFHIDPTCVNRLNKLIGCEIVISSSWDYTEETVQGLKNAGLKLPIIGGIDHIEYNEQYLCRGNAIAKWFNDRFNKHIPYDYLFDSDGWYNTDVTYSSDFGLLNKIKQIGKNNVQLNYVIIDDTNDMLIHQQKHFIHVNSKKGLTDDNILKAMNILNIK